MAADQGWTVKQELPWHRFGTVALPTYRACVPEYQGRPHELWRHLSYVLRQELVYATLRCAELGGNATFSKPECVAQQALARRRVEEQVEKAELPRATKTALVCLSRRRSERNDALRRQAESFLR